MRANRSVFTQFFVLLTILAATTSEAAPKKAKQPDKLVVEYEAAWKAGTIDQSAGQLAADIDRPDAQAKPDAQARLEALASVLGKQGDGAVPVIEKLLGQKSTMAPTVAADLLWRIARQKQFTPAMAALSAKLLGHDDPFVRGLAEWAIAIKVGADNNGAEVVWPRPNPPEWYKTWIGLEADALIEADYVRMAVGWNLHCESRRLIGSVDAVRNRARAAAAEALRSPSPQTRSMVARQLAELDSIQSKISGHATDSPADLIATRKLWLSARRAARPIVLANPAVDFQELLFVKHYPQHSHRNITGSQYPWTMKPGGDICVQTGLQPGGKSRSVLKGQLGPGHVHGIDLWWDADRMVFGYAKQTKWPPKYDPIRGNHVFLLRGDQEPTHLFEIKLDGTGLRQLTGDSYWSDLEPTYCADGRIVFSSDRSGRSSECGNFGADHTVVNIYSIDADGKNLRRLNDNKDIDRHPHSLDNGLIAYTRWEYQERHFFETHAIWTIRPDGTKADAVFNQHLRYPCGLRDTRSIPGSSKLVSIATGHHTFAYGPVVVVDPRVGINTTGSIEIVTSHSVPQEGGMSGTPVAEGGVVDQGGLYQTPWALSEKCFLVSYSHAQPGSDTRGGNNTNGYAIYLIDVFGNKELVHRDRVLSCSSPMPLRRRGRPPILPDVTTPDERFATCYLSDVYHGLDGVPRGTVKHLRISQRIGWPLDSKIGAMRWIANNAFARQMGVTTWAPVRVIGTVPVEEDGSAHFKVPVDAAVYFHALDENHMEVRRMRSHVTFQPGEVRGCLGCHETKMKTPATEWRMAMAMKRPPVTPTPPSWGAEKLLGYEWLVQPILDRHCVRCHGHDKPEGGIELTATPAEFGRFRSFRTLLGHYEVDGKPGKTLVSVSNRFSDSGITRPMEFGSHKSPMVRVLLDDDLHKKEVKLDPDEWRTLVTWVDANAPYHDKFFNRRPADGGEPRRDILMEFPVSLSERDEGLGARD